MQVKLPRASFLLSALAITILAAAPGKIHGFNPSESAFAQSGRPFHKSTQLLSDTIFFDDFNKDFPRCEWKSSIDRDSRWIASIKGGWYSFENTTPYEAIKTNTLVPLDTAFDFEIEIAVKISRESENDYVGVFWGSGERKLSESIPITSFNFIKKSTTISEQLLVDTLVIRKHGSSFFLNDTLSTRIVTNFLQSEGSLKALSGRDIRIKGKPKEEKPAPEKEMTELGFMVGPGVKIEVDYILIRQDQKINLRAYPFPCFEEESIPAIDNGKNGLRPLISPDGQTLFFSQEIAPRADEYVLMSTTRDPLSGEFQTPMPVKSALGISNIGTAGISTNFDFFWGLNPSDRRSLIEYHLKNGEWAQRIIEIPQIPKNTENHQSFHISKDGNVLLFNSDSGTEGSNSDIFVCLKKDNGEWGPPKNLGKKVNSTGDELTPFLAPDNKTLFFSSVYDEKKQTGWPGYGEADIFVVTRLDNSWTNWSEAENLGPAINSANREWYFSVGIDSTDWAYFCRQVGPSEKIFRVRVPGRPAMALVLLKLVDNVSNLPVEINLNAKLVEENTPIPTECINESNQIFKAIVPRGTEIKVNLEGLAYEAQDTLLLIPHGQKDTIIEFTIELTPIFKLFNFNYDSAEILPENKPKLDLIRKIMIDNPDLCLLIEGHASEEGSEGHNYLLSRRRSEAVKKHLGLGDERIILRWKGEKEPLDCDPKVRGKIECLEMNRRVEISFDCESNSKNCN